MPISFISSAWSALSGPYNAPLTSHQSGPPSDRVGSKTDSNGAASRETAMPGSWGEESDDDEDQSTTPRAQPAPLPSVPSLPPPSIEIEEVFVEDEDENEPDWPADDAPPAFPALNSIQRSGRDESVASTVPEPTTYPLLALAPSVPLTQSSPGRSVLGLAAPSSLGSSTKLQNNAAATLNASRGSAADAQRMPPPSFLPTSRSTPPPGPTSSITSSTNASLSNLMLPPSIPIPSAAGRSPLALSSASTSGSTLSPRPTFSIPSISEPISAGQPDIDAGSLLSPLVTAKVPPNTNTKKKVRAKVALTPGHSPLDWGRLKSSGQDLRAGVTELLRISPSQLKQHNTREDAWSAFGGKVYNITPYLEFHPGGEKELMRVAGRDGTKLFALTHSWVNLDYMLDGCMVGFLVADAS